MISRHEQELSICHVQPLSLDLFGHDDESWGASTRYFLPNIVSAQIERGDRPEVHLLTNGRARDIVVNSVKVQFHRCVEPPASVGVSRRFARQFSPSMLAAVARSKSDVIHFHGNRSLQSMLGLSAAANRLMSDVPFVSQDHGVRIPRWTGSPLGRLGLRLSDAVMAANDASLNAFELMKLTNIAPFIIPNGVDSEIFHPRGRSAERPSGPFLVLVVSRMWQDKDPMSMAQAVAEVARSGRQIAVRIISEGPLRDEVVSVLRSAGVAVDVIDHVDQTELAEHYRAADVLVLTSLREGFNQATIEAMACGLPVVASDIAGIREGVGVAGLLIPPASPALVARALRELIDDPDLRAKLCMLGLEQSRQFTWEGVTNRLDAVYRKAIVARRNR